MSVVALPPLRPPQAGPPLAGPPPPAADVHDTAHDHERAAGDDPTVLIVRRARWERPALVALLAGTAVLYLWGLSASGWANAYYSAAVQAGSQSWKAFLFGSTDESNAITVDKPPMSLWPMALSVRIFGVSSWSILAPQALMGVGTVGILFSAVRRRCGAVAGLLAGAVMALTPVAVLMFRFNNPDALLVLLLTAAAAALVRSIEDGRRRWIVAAGALIGFGFLTKQLQALVVVPGFAVAYLVAAAGSIGARIRRLLLGAGAMVVAAGWWIALVMLWPAGSRPYVGGSQTNNILDLTLGYNGFGRITGDESGSVGGGGGWGATGWTRLVDGVIGGQISWLLPAAVLLTLGALWALRRAPRSDGRRALLLVFGSWLVVTFLVFSFMQGIFHEYYTVALAPAVAALVGVGAAVLWHHREHVAGAGLLAGTTALTATWSAMLLSRSPGWNPWLAPLVVVVGLTAAAGLLAAPLVARRAGTGPTIARAAAAGAIVAALAGPATWSVATAATPHTGSIVTAGPAVAGARSGP
ncbi:MAG: glycosyltransferase family 39 protein, partial [Ilumatobacteraceae bacterium]